MNKRRKKVARTLRSPAATKNSTVVDSTKATNTTTQHEQKSTRPQELDSPPDPDISRRSRTIRQVLEGAKKAYPSMCNLIVEVEKE